MRIELSDLIEQFKKKHSIVERVDQDIHEFAKQFPPLATPRKDALPRRPLVWLHDHWENAYDIEYREEGYKRNQQIQKFAQNKINEYTKPEGIRLDYSDIWEYRWEIPTYEIKEVVSI